MSLVGNPKPGSLNPWAPFIDHYEKGKYGFDIQSVSQPRGMMAQNFDPMRQRALGAVNAGVQSGTQTAMQSLMQSGGLSAADRQALQSQGQRQRVNLAQGAMAPIDQMAAQNMYDTQKFNVGAQQNALDMNQDFQNRRGMEMASQNEARAVNLYQQRMKEAFLERQLAKAKELYP
ncbi:MAG TPA: hypothetical protein VE954_43115 [Oligoflexus sp.]|uniref:hypothetical protein n=1 Tax=Oligoflexus sp. TaxID=1971216 RepID=UPI002D52EAE5|nr:hypothetical protein [Oligoflexus sp.]HYX39935.1 hypothetical protein [Oligoflexus sp.]